MGNRLGRKPLWSRSGRGQREGNQRKETSGTTPSTSKEALEEIIRRGPISKYYTVYEQVELGRGHYAVVNLAVDKKTKENYAVKRIQIRKSRLESLQLEVHVLLQVGAHPNIVTLHDIFITETEVQLVMELLTGGELFDRMVESGPYTEQEASNHIGKIAHALKYLHSKNVVHRDLKPENLILASKEPDAELKMADFGLSKFVSNIQSSTMNTVCGTWAYCAPEVRESIKSAGREANYTAKVDIWSTGVIMFVMLSAYHPFDPNGDLSDKQLWDNICKGEFNFEDPAWNDISDMAKDLICHLIVKDPEKRYTAEQMLQHPWIARNAEVPMTPMTNNLHLFKRRQHPGMFGAMSPLTNVPMRPGSHQHVPMLQQPPEVAAHPQGQGERHKQQFAEGRDNDARHYGAQQGDHGYQQEPSGDERQQMEQHARGQGQHAHYAQQTQHEQQQFEQSQDYQEVQGQQFQAPIQQLEPGQDIAAQQHAQLIQQQHQFTQQAAPGVQQHFISQDSEQSHSLQQQEKLGNVPSEQYHIQQTNPMNPHPHNSAMFHASPMHVHQNDQLLQDPHQLEYQQQQQQIVSEKAYDMGRDHLMESTHRQRHADIIDLREQGAIVSQESVGPHPSEKHEASQNGAPQLQQHIHVSHSAPAQSRFGEEVEHHEITLGQGAPKPYTNTIAPHEMSPIHFDGANPGDHQFMSTSVPEYSHGLEDHAGVPSHLEYSSTALPEGGLRLDVTQEVTKLHNVDELLSPMDVEYN